MHGSLEHLSVAVDMCAPGWERIVDPSPPIEVIARDIIFGEGPTWDARNRQLYFTDIIGDTIWIIAARNIRTGEELTYDYATDGPGHIRCLCSPGCEVML